MGYIVADCARVVAYPETKHICLELLRHFLSCDQGVLWLIGYIAKRSFGADYTEQLLQHDELGIHPTWKVNSRNVLCKKPRLVERVKTV